MIRILIFLLLVLTAGAGFAWLADRPGMLTVNFAGYEYRVTLLVAAAMLMALVSLILITWWLIAGLWNSPRTISRYFRARKRDRGYQALSTGLIAAGAGDPGLARKMNKQAAGLINSDQEPLMHLLDAQVLLLEGDRAGARKKFEAMAADPETRIFGLRGLYLEAERAGEREAARHYAERAAAIAPQLEWAAASTLEAKVSRGDHDGALALVDAQRSARQIDKAAAARRKAVLLTAKAEAQADLNPAEARAAAIEANRLAPELVPAAVLAAKAHFATGDLKRGAKILEASWKTAPHPEIADAYVMARPGDSTQDRLGRAERLEVLKPSNPESSLAVARAALAAGEFKKARAAAEAALRMSPREGAWLLMADIEEAETGDQGRVRQHLGRALRAPSDPAWTADGFASERWAAFSPVTGRLDAFEWRLPVEKIAGPVIEVEAPFAANKPAEPEVIDVPEAPAAEKPALAAPAPARTSETMEPEEQAILLPDDPGIDDAAAEPRRGFRLF